MKLSATYLFLLLIFSLTVPLAVNAQHYSYAHYDMRDGLAGSTVYSMITDQDGFMWFATDGGLSRFDGTRFRNFTTEDGLPDNELIKLFLDSRHRLWIIPFKNSVCYYQNGRIHNADNDSVLRKLSFASELISVRENDKGVLLFMEAHKLTLLYPDGHITLIDLQQKHLSGIKAARGGVRDFTIVANRQDKQSGVYHINGDSLQLLQLFNTYSGYSTIYLSHDFNIYRRGEWLQIDAGEATDSIPLPQGMINLGRVNDSTFYISTTTAVTLYHTDTWKKFDDFLPGKNITDVTSDEEGNLWFASMGQGVFRLPSLAFRSYTFHHRGEDMPVYSIRKSSNHLLAGTEYFLLWQQSGKDAAFTSRAVCNGRTLGRVISIDPIDDQSLVVGTDFGLYQYTNGHICNEFSGVAVKQTQQRGDLLWVAGARNALLVNTRTKKTDTLWNSRSTCIYNLDSITYIGTLRGLYRLRQHRPPVFMGDEVPVFNHRIVALNASENGILWVGTYGDGIVGYKNGRVLFAINRKNGLTSNICRSLYIDHNTVWLGTDKGLNKITTTGNAFSLTTYTHGDGLMSDVVNTIYVDGKTVYVGTPLGISYFEEEKVFTNSMCNLKILGIRSERQMFPGYDKQVEFNHFDNDLSIEYAGISFKSGGDITYGYRLLGLDKSWHTTRETQLAYPSLASGNYELQMVATNKFGVQSEMVCLRFDVEKVFWQKIWFRVTVIILVVSLIWFFISYRIKTAQRKQTEKLLLNQKIAELEQRALKSQMNPHFIFNSLNSIQQYVIDKDIVGANKFITGFSRLIRLTLDMSSKTRISLEEEIDYLKAYLQIEKVRFEDKFNYEIEVDRGIDTSLFFIPPMILQPFIENSIRHGVRYRHDTEGMVWIRFFIRNGFFICSVQDNGIGRAMSQQLKGETVIEYQSKGMSLTAKRLDMLNLDYETPASIIITDLMNDNNQAEGTLVELQFPLQEATKPRKKND